MTSRGYRLSPLPPLHIALDPHLDLLTQNSHKGSLATPTAPVHQLSPINIPPRLTQPRCGTCMQLTQVLYRVPQNHQLRLEAPSTARMTWIMPGTELQHHHHIPEPLHGITGPPG